MSARIERAKIEAERARRQLVTTVSEVQQRLKPATIADQAWSGVKDKGSEMADDAMEAVKARPAATAGVLAALLLFVARRPIVSRASRLWKRKSKNGTENGLDNGIGVRAAASSVEE
jgi:ElaB/YqjD/DUF883 family membrane-anchored ribosome-binding protein